MKTITEKIACDKILNKAYEHVCFSRKKHHCNSDIWDLRTKWKEEKNNIQNELLNGTCCFAETTVVRGAEGSFELWSSKDGVVLKAITLVLNEKFNGAISKNCYHIKGRGGVKAAVNCVKRHVQNYKYVFKSDIKSYYASIDHEVMYNILEKHIDDRLTLRLIYRFMKRSVCRDGNYYNVDNGICRGSSLSPLLGALYLAELDNIFNNSLSVQYCRFMDDWVVLSNNKHQLRRYIRKSHKILEGLKLKLAIDKTFVGKVYRGFDFLGFDFSHEAMTVSQKTVTRFLEKITAKVHRWVRRGVVYNTDTRWNRFYESGLNSAKNKKGCKTLAESISLYVKNWVRWLVGFRGTCINTITTDT